ncbi:MAG: protease modulator HflC [Phycisphaerae bacterium]|nr:protease modulator HflC [Phycisphaerae bacterium]
MRRNIPSMVAGVALVLLLLVYAVTYQVRFTEIAIKTTFGKPSDPNETDPNSPGLRFKWPWPIQGVVKYDKRIQILDSPEEQAQTADRQILILTVFAGWRISDGVEFLQKVETVREAEDRLRKHLRSEIGAVVGQHSFGDFVSTDPNELKLSKIETEIQGGVAERAKAYGITIETLGIRRIILPQTTTEKVFDQMRAQRTAMAEKTRSEGEAIARRIRSQAESLKQQILSFAASKAKDIEAEGEVAAAKEYEVFSEDEDFANFLRELEFLKEALKRRTIFFLDEKIPGIQMLKEDRAIIGGSAPKVPTPTEPKRLPAKPAAGEAAKKASKGARDVIIQEPKK